MIGTYIVRRRSRLLHPNQRDLCWLTRRIIYRYAYEWYYIFGMVVIGGLCMKLCNFVVLELLALPVNCQKAFETTTPEPTRYAELMYFSYFSNCWDRHTCTCSSTLVITMHKITNCMLTPLYLLLMPIASCSSDVYLRWMSSSGVMWWYVFVS